MQQIGRAPRREIAPSRWSYRMQRLWLTPLFRVLFRVGLPVFVLFGAIALYLQDDQRRAHLAQVFVDLREDFQARPEFRVSLIAVDGAAPELAEAIRARLDLALPQSSFDIDLEAARNRVEALDAVETAQIKVRTGGVLQVDIIERTPVMLWRTEDRIDMLDAGGHRVASLAARSDRPDLPLIAGEGADKAAAEAMAVLAAASPLEGRIRGLVRISDRRWDIVLDRDQRIMLPAENPVAAVERLLVLDQAQDIMARDVAAIDLRIAARPVLRLTPYAQLQLRRAQGLEPPESDL
ncbi:MAG: cell division protein FtsQ/DivIB [Rhodobacteraceae bacterium]|jgi:cell division protein FtsQ|nr:cell division protein FtsQ/DivIB [Paracoccaceae bacterium]